MARVAPAAQGNPEDEILDAVNAVVRLLRPLPWKARDRVLSAVVVLLGMD